MLIGLRAWAALVGRGLVKVGEFGWMRLPGVLAALAPAAVGAAAGMCNAWHPAPRPAAALPRKPPAGKLVGLGAFSLQPIGTQCMLTLVCPWPLVQLPLPVCNSNPALSSGIACASTSRKCGKLSVPPWPAQKLARIPHPAAFHWHLRRHAEPVELTGLQADCAVCDLPSAVDSSSCGHFRQCRIVRSS